LCGAECCKGERSGFTALLLEKSASFDEIHFFCGVIRLAEGIAEGGDKMRALTREDDRLFFFHGQRDKRGPAGVDAKAEGRGLHGASREKDQGKVEKVREVEDVPATRCSSSVRARQNLICHRDTESQREKKERGTAQKGKELIQNGKQAQRSRAVLGECGFSVPCLLGASVSPWQIFGFTGRLYVVWWSYL